MRPEDVALGKIAGFVAQGSRQSKRASGWSPESWHRSLTIDDDLTWALAHRDLTLARNRIRAVVLRHYAREIPQHVESALRYLGVVLKVEREG